MFLLYFLDTYIHMLKNSQRVPLDKCIINLHSLHQDAGLSLACFGDYLQRVITGDRQLFRKILIYIFFINLTGMCGKPLQIAPKQC